MKRRIEDPTRAEGYYYGYESAADCIADYEADVGRNRGTNLEAVAGYACLWVFLAVIVTLSVLAGMFQW